MMIGWLGVREAVNIGLLLGDISLIYILIKHVLIPEMKHAGWFNHVYNQLAFFLTIYFTGQGIVRTWGAFLLYAMRHGGNVFAAENAYPISLIGTVAALGGLLGIIWAFSPGQRRHSTWIAVLLLTGLMALATYLYE